MVVVGIVGVGVGGGGEYGGCGVFLSGFSQISLFHSVSSLCC
jgi:hypothetical protein